MDLLIGQDGSVTLTAEMLAHLGVKPGDKLSVKTTADRHLELCPPAKAPGDKLLRVMLDRTAQRG